MKKTVIGKGTKKGIVNILFRVPPGREKEYEEKIYLMAEALEIQILGLTEAIIKTIISGMEHKPIRLEEYKRRKKSEIKRRANKKL